jgi:hypothetical protein
MMAAHPGDIAGQIELQVARITVLGHGIPGLHGLGEARIIRPGGSDR